MFFKREFNIIRIKFMLIFFLKKTESESSIVCFKIEDFCFVNEQITIITIVVEAQIKFFFGLLKLTLNVFSREPKLPLML